MNTSSAQKISGRFSIDNSAIVINGERIELSDIADIKRNPLLVSALSSGLLIYGGAIVAGAAIIGALFVEGTWFLLTIPAAAMIYAGIKSPNFSKKYKNDGTYSIELITLTP